MQVSFVDKPKAGWRGRGHPRREIPPQVIEAAETTYKTGRVGVVSIEPDEEQETKELIRCLRSYAKSRNRHMRIQRDDDVVRFEMVDKQPARKKATP